MTTHRQRSFIAAVSSEHGTLGYLNQLHSETLLHPFGGFSWISFSPSSAAHILSHVGGSRNTPPLLWYFRSTDTGYVIFVRSQQFFGRSIGLGEGYFGALNTKGEIRCKFRFEPVAGDEGRSGVEIGEGDEIMTKLVSLDTGNALCLRQAYFKYRAGKIWQTKNCSYVAADGGEPLNLRLKIIQMNAPYLNTPDEE